MVNSTDNDITADAPWVQSLVQLPTEAVKAPMDETAL